MPAFGCGRQLELPMLQGPTADTHGVVRVGRVARTKPNRGHTGSCGGLGCQRVLP